MVVLRSSPKVSRSSLAGCGGGDETKKGRLDSTPSFLVRCSTSIISEQRRRRYKYRIVLQIKEKSHHSPIQSINSVNTDQSTQSGFPTRESKDRKGTHNLFSLLHIHVVVVVVRNTKRQGLRALQQPQRGLSAIRHGQGDARQARRADVGTMRYERCFVFGGMMMIVCCDDAVRIVVFFAPLSLTHVCSLSFFLPPLVDCPLFPRSFRACPNERLP